MSNNISNLNIGVIGTGIFARDAHLPTIEKIPELTISACYNRTKAKAEDFAKLAGIPHDAVLNSMEEIFTNKDVDIADALLPVQYNLDVVKLAIEHKKPICLEKPIAANLTQARAIVKLAEKTDLPIGILENWSFLSATKLIKKEVYPKIGDVLGFTYNATGAWNEENKYLNTNWRLNPEHIGGFLSDGGVHQLALLTDILGDVETVSSLTRQVRKESGADDVLFSTLKMANGAIGTFTYASSFGAAEKASYLKVYGTNGSFTYDFSPSLTKPTITYRTGTSAQNASKAVVIEIDEVDTYVGEFQNFVLAVTKKDKSLVGVSPAKAFHHLAIVAAALESSAKNGDSIRVEKV